MFIRVYSFKANLQLFLSLLILPMVSVLVVVLGWLLLLVLFVILGWSLWVFVAGLMLTCYHGDVCFLDSSTFHQHSKNRN
jgi:hypothetical protein